MADFDFSTLVFDRTAGDVAARNDKGVYSYTDLNRVGEAVAALTPMLQGLGFLVDTSPRVDWVENEIPRLSGIRRYVDDVRAMNQLRYWEAVLPLPVGPGRLDYLGANNMERMLYEVRAAVDRIRAGWMYSGEIFSGEIV